MALHLIEHKKNMPCIGHHIKSHLYILCSTHSYVLAESDLYLFLIYLTEMAAKACTAEQSHYYSPLG